MELLLVKIQVLETSHNSRLEFDTDQESDPHTDPFLLEKSTQLTFTVRYISKTNLFSNFLR